MSTAPTARISRLGWPRRWRRSRRSSVSSWSCSVVSSARRSLMSRSSSGSGLSLASNTTVNRAQLPGQRASTSRPRSSGQARGGRAAPPKKRRRLPSSRQCTMIASWRGFACLRCPAQAGGCCSDVRPGRGGARRSARAGSRRLHDTSPASPITASAFGPRAAGRHIPGRPAAFFDATDAPGLLHRCMPMARHDRVLGIQRHGRGCGFGERPADCTGAIVTASRRPVSRPSDGPGR
jgi:hypothetical protein